MRRAAAAAIARYGGSGGHHCRHWAAPTPPTPRRWLASPVPPPPSPFSLAAEMGQPAGAPSSAAVATAAAVAAAGGCASPTPLKTPPTSSPAPPPRARLTDLSGLGPTVFYKAVTVVAVSPSPTSPPTASARTPPRVPSYGVALDGTLVLTPHGRPLATPSLPLTTALAAEYGSQTGRMRPASMPLCRLVTAGLDAAAVFRPRMISSLLDTFADDAAAYRAGHPSELRAAQEAAWAPFLAWAPSVLGGTPLTVGQPGVMLGITQAPAAVEAAAALVAGLNDLELAAMETAAGAAKSLLVGLALWRRAVSLDAAIAAARAEEAWQSGVWGRVVGGHDVDEAEVEVRLAAADMLFRCMAGVRTVAAAEAAGGEGGVTL
ncbi:hypothetical protein MMPV_007922 [Pyropia vietnamensis]